MALLKQLAAAILLLILAGAVWLRLDDAPGRYLLAEGSPLPETLRPVVSAISRGDDAPRIGPTPTPGAGWGSGIAPLVVVDAAVSNVTRERLRAVATAEAQRSVAIYPEANGFVTEVAFRPGDTVNAGDVLARLDSEDQRLAVERARIALAAAEEQVERYQRLAGSSAASVTTVQLDEVRRAAETARLDLSAAEIALARRDVVAPIDGRVGLSGVEIGALVTTQSLVATVDDRDSLKLVFNAPEAYLAELSPGHLVRAMPTSRTGRVHEGEIFAVDSRVDEASRTVRVEALVDNSEDRLRPGMSFSLEIAFAGQEFLSVDPLSVQWEREGPYVWVIRANRAEKAPIRIVERNVERILVASDEITQGEAVAVEGIQSLREGIEVRVRNPLPEPAGIPSAGIVESMGDTTPLPDPRRDGGAEL